MTLSVGIYNQVPEALSETLFVDRRRQFVNRYNWNLCVTPEGYEIDEYDSEGTEYLVVHENNRHLTSCRLRPVTMQTMVLDHFSEVFPTAEVFLKNQPGRLYELTRFLRAPSLSVHQGKIAQLAFAKLLDRFRDAREAVGFIAVVYSSVSRYLRQNGVQFIVVSVSIINGRPVELICITQAVPARRLLFGKHRNARGSSYPHSISRNSFPRDQRVAA